MIAVMLGNVTLRRGVYPSPEAAMLCITYSSNTAQSPACALLRNCSWAPHSSHFFVQLTNAFYFLHRNPHPHLLTHAHRLST